ncbi:hypothetical protein P5P86_11700 [Nocardioides sp. BP30]|uniref:hypothetical protein n=1 Tax=Nocardioides sp. BP30 TaxID=3036374 RepID=UPI0024690CEF|nr:hypothetical protein [Nocardioides sp. BP30]WGL50628.1 hypothetical protein P5P86_11700 [Nocardioides sp. BP30]
MSAHGADRDRITIARLDGTARRHVFERSQQEVAVAELVEIATERVQGRPPRLRVDLLTIVAGSMLGAHRHAPDVRWVEPLAIPLLIVAGADPGGMEPHADETLKALGDGRRGGIGQP